MGWSSAAPPKPTAPPPAADTTKAQLNALAYAETQRKLRASGGRKSTFLTAGGSLLGGNTLLGQ